MLTAITIQATQTVPPNSSSKVFDDACGIGTVTTEVKKLFPEIPVLAIDSSAGMLKIVDHKVKKHHLKNVTTRLLDGGNLTGTPIQPAMFTLFLRSYQLHSLLSLNKQEAKVSGT